MWFFIFGCLIACTGQPAASVSCPIEMSPPSVVVRFGDPFSVNCSSSEPIEGMGWESTYRGISLTDGVSSLLLEIDSVKDWDIESKCFINALDGEQCLKKLPITVYKPPESVTLSVPNHTGAMVEGETYEIKCDVYNVAPAGRLSLDWLLPYTTPVQSLKESSLAPVNISSSLELTADRKYNGAKIGCEALLILGPTAPELGMESNTHELIVLYPPTFAEPAHETLEVVAGSETVLNCTAAGNPTPLYAWHFPPTIKEKDKIWNEYQPLLTPSFPGTYNCTASNKLGTETKSFTVVEVKRDRTTFAALIGGFVSLGVLLIAAGLFFGTPEGTLSCSKGGYLRGQPTSSGIV